MSFNRTYQYYKNIFQGIDFPYAFVDLDLFDENIKNIAPRAGDKLIRVASKSVRCRSLIKRALDSGLPYQGIMTFSLDEAVWLSQEGFDDLLMGYPGWNPNQIERVCAELQKGKQIILMVDLPEHIHHLNQLGEKFNTVIPVCIDLDMSSDYPGIHFGVWRSSIRSKEDALALYSIIERSNFVRLDALMGYEAQIAGLGDNVPGKGVMNSIIKMLKGRSIKEISKRREDTVQGLKDAGADLKIVNGGGTGSLESTRQEKVVTEVTVGSGFYNSGLFDNYSNFRHYPSAAYAVEIVRKPKADTYTCHGGGYTASGAMGKDKLPIPYLPEGAKLYDEEAAGEVQTPVIYTGSEKLNIGDPVYLRHSKAGELCERFTHLYLVSDGKIIDQVPTYRGEGKCFV